jgi:hypothetical protein
LQARVKHPATVAENVTAAVDQIIWREFRFRLKKPIDLSVRRDGVYWLIGYEAIGVEGYGRSEQAALESFADQFYGAWKWIAQPDGSQLTGEARKLKRKLMSMVASVQPAG